MEIAKMIVVLIIFLIILILFSLYCWGKRHAANSLKIYPIIFTVPILVIFVLSKFTLILGQGIGNQLKLMSWFESYSTEFTIIFLSISSVFIIISLSSYQYFKSKPLQAIKKNLLPKIPDITAMSVFLLIVYTCISGIAGQDGRTIYINGEVSITLSEDKKYNPITLKTNDKTLTAIKKEDRSSAGESLALVAAIIAGCFSFYTVQRTSKQESTKNRQAWITDVRYESAKLIATIDKIKLRKLSKDICCSCACNRYLGNTSLEPYEALIDSCTKLRMLLNPNDLIAPILTIQLDTIMDELSGNTLSINGNSKNYFPIRCDFEKVNLRKSFMPWIQILLKVEWERVKATLESREITVPDYYSSTIFREEWDAEKYKQFGIDEDILLQAYKTIVKLKIKIENPTKESKETIKKHLTDIDIQDLRKTAFSGFYLTDDETTEIIYCLFMFILYNNFIIKFCLNKDSQRQ